MAFATEDNNPSALKSQPVKDSTLAPSVDAKEHPNLTKVPEVLPEPDDIYSKREYAKNTFNNQQAINIDRRAQIVNYMKGFAEGSPITVTYYKDQNPETDIGGKLKISEFDMNDVHYSYLRIHGFEMRLTAALSYEHDRENGQESRLTGEAICYPGFRPEMGDRFTMEIDHGTIGLMTIDEIPERTAIRSSTYHRIHFWLTNIMSDEVQQALDNRVRDEAWFDKKRFLNEPGALLLHDEVVELKFLHKQYHQMASYYISKFFERKVYRSIIRPDEVYDPYIVDFLHQIIDYRSMGGLPIQFMEDAPYMDVNIWRAILKETIPLRAVPTGAEIKKLGIGSTYSRLNALINKNYLCFVDSPSVAKLGDDADGDGVPDGFEQDADDILDMETNAGNDMIGDLLIHLHPHYNECLFFGESATAGSDVAGGFGFLYSGSQEHQDLLTAFLSKRDINLKALRICIENVYNLPPMEQFYKMPLYMFLAMRAIEYIRKESGVYE